MKLEKVITNSRIIYYVNGVEVCVYYFNQLREEGFEYTEKEI